MKDFVIRAPMSQNPEPSEWLFCWPKTMIYSKSLFSKLTSIMCRWDHQLGTMFPSKIHKHRTKHRSWRTLKTWSVLASIPIPFLGLVSQIFHTFLQGFADDVGLICLLVLSFPSNNLQDSRRNFKNRLCVHLGWHVCTIVLHKGTCLFVSNFYFRV